MFSLTDPERQLLERLAAEGKASRLYEGDLPIAKSLEGVGLLFLIGDRVVPFLLSCHCTEMLNVAYYCCSRCSSRRLSPSIWGVCCTQRRTRRAAH